jgi:hypothetical protein
MRWKNDKEIIDLFWIGSFSLGLILGFQGDRVNNVTFIKLAYILGAGGFFTITCTLGISKLISISKK